MSDVETTTPKKAPTRREVLKQLEAAVVVPTPELQDPIELEYKRREQVLAEAKAEFAQKLRTLGIDRASDLTKVTGALASLGRAAQQAGAAIRSIPRSDIELPEAKLLDPAQQAMIDALDSGIKAVDTAKAAVTPIKRATRKGPKFPEVPETPTEEPTEAIVDEAPIQEGEPETPTSQPLEQPTHQPSPAERAAANKERIKQEKIAAIKAEAAAQDAADAAPQEEPSERLSDDEANVDEGF